MSDFILFNQALEEYKKTKVTEEEVKSEEEEGAHCFHNNIISEKGVNVCVDCGEEVQNNITHDKEWRYYGQSDTKHSSDPNRVQMRKIEERSIFKDVENLGFSESIISKANKIYAQVTQGKIFRGNSRKAIVFACVFHAYKMSGKPQSHERLIQIFNLTERQVLKVLNMLICMLLKNPK